MLLHGPRRSVGYLRCLIMLLMVVLGMGLSSYWCTAFHYWIGHGMLVSKLGLARVCQSSTFVAGPIQHFKNATLQAWGSKRAKDFAKEKGFVVALNLDASQQLLVSSHVRERSKDHFEAFFLGVYGLDFYLDRSEEKFVPCRFCGGLDGDGHLFWDCPYPPLMSM